MSVATKLQSGEKRGIYQRAILGPTGNRVRVLEESRRKGPVLKKPPVADTPQTVIKNNLSVDSSCSSDSDSNSFSSSSSSLKVATPKRTVKPNVFRTVKVLPQDQDVPVKRCDWITPNSDPLYASFHDEEWGIPVHDDRKLFELLVFSQALAEMSWPAILQLRDVFRELFDNFDPSSIAQFTEKKLLTLKVNGNLILSQPKLRAIVENAKLVLKIQQEFGSLSNYCWRFVNHKPLRNGYRYARQIPVKTPKADVISKDLMQRGFRCVGPTVVYSFMQVAGIVNDHLVTCFRCIECNSDLKQKCNPKIEETETEIVTLEKPK
ncbi:DNA glycosylase superfamily protein [Euphorbia peplus]|nr:DNA glycosylase superfamily protein [Euphorbia peplus]